MSATLKPQGSIGEKSLSTTDQAGKDIFFKDCALMRFNEKPEQAFNVDEASISDAVQVVTDKGLSEILAIRANDNFWKTVNCIQTNVKAPIGCGTPIIVNFYAPVNPDDITATMNYDFRQFGNDEDLIRNNEETYCLK